MGIRTRLTVGLGMLLALGALAVSATADDANQFPFGSDEFEQVWERNDLPVSQGEASRTWIWGPGPRSSAMIEEYDGGTRLVQYFEKARMEAPTDALADPSSPWFITQGLLAVELMTGNLQLGDHLFEEHAPAEIPIAGDPDDVSGATYAAMGKLMFKPPRQTGSIIVETVDSKGAVSVDLAFAEYGVFDEFFDEVTHHNIASVFWAFMNSSGAIALNGDLAEGPLFEDPFYGVGRPVTEAFWATVRLAGEPQDVLTQCFERRCLTYAPDNPEGWQVESGNIGMHYREWRYQTIQRETPINAQVSVLTNDVSMPNGLSVAGDGRIFFVEIWEGTIRVIEDGQLLEEPFAKLDIARPGGRNDFGALGLALHPDFDQNGFLYVFYSAGDSDGQPIDQRIVRYTNHNNRGVGRTVIVDGLPFGVWGGTHNGGRMAFSPNGMLYVTIGDVEYPPYSQDPQFPAGSVLRYTEYGDIPASNPFGEDNPVFAYGLRNSFGIAFHPQTRQLYVTDNGPEGYDEVNRIVAGGNYGWPEAMGIAGDPDYIDPVWSTRRFEAIAPTGMTIPTGAGFPDLAGWILFCHWNTSTLMALELDPDDPDGILSEMVLPADCQLDVAEGPDGTLYTATAGAIYRITPVGD
jgi:glucose/arabinose dehydrogenase